MGKEEATLVVGCGMVIVCVDVIVALIVVGGDDVEMSLVVVDMSVGGIVVAASVVATAVGVADTDVLATVLVTGAVDVATKIKKREKIY